MGTRGDGVHLMTSIPGQSPESITEAELAEALREIAGRNQADLVPVACPPQTARAIFGIIQDRREPKYEQGRMYQDANGRIWLYQPERNYADAGSWADCPWLKPGDAAAYSLNSPKRPLCKLVPEGSPLSEHERDLVHADLGKLLELLGLRDGARPWSSHEVFLTCLDAVIKLKAEAGR